MKRSIAPEARRRILKSDISLDIKQENDKLAVEVTLRNLAKEGYPKDAEIILEAYNSNNIERINLGTVGTYNGEKQEHPLPFRSPSRPKIHFRLKIIEPDSCRLLGYAEKLSEQKYADALLIFGDTKESVKNMYQIDFDAPKPILYLNPKLSRYREQLKHVLFEVAFKDILNYILFQSEEERESYEFFNYANKLVRYTDEEKDDEAKREWIQEVLCKHAETLKSIPKMTKGLKSDD